MDKALEKFRNEIAISFRCLLKFFLILWGSILFKNGKKSAKFGLPPSSITLSMAWKKSFPSSDLELTRSLESTRFPTRLNVMINTYLDISSSPDSPRCSAAPESLARMEQLQLQYQESLRDARANIATMQADNARCNARFESSMTHYANEPHWHLPD